MIRLRRLLGGLPAQLGGIILISVALLVTVIAVGGVSAHSQAMRSLIGIRDERATRTAALALTERLTGRFALLQTLAAHAADGAGIEQMLEAAPVLAEAFDNGLLLVDDQGEVRWAWQPGQAWAWNMTSATPLQFQVIEGEPLVQFQTAAGSEGVLVGASSLTSLDVAGLLDPLRSTDQTLVLLVAADGRTLFHSGALSADIIPAMPGVSEALRGESGATYLHAANGEELVVTYSPIQLGGWALVVQEPWEEVTSVTLRLSENAPLIMVPVIVFAVLALSFGLWQVVRPLQRLEQRASRLAWGDYEAIRQPVGGIAEIGDLQRALARMAQRVAQAESARQSYIGAITQGQEEERARLARELHDETVQALIALGQRLQSIERQLDRDPDETRQRIAGLRTMVNQTLDEVRRIIHAMRPSYLEDLGLVPALKALCQETEQKHGLEVAFRHEGEGGRLAPEVEVSLYRVAQEALNNVVRHAEATRVEVLLTTDGPIRLVVCDNGKGFEVPAQPDRYAASQHFGLMAISERVRLIGGSLAITSAPQQGTCLTVQGVQSQVSRPVRD